MKKIVVYLILIVSSYHSYGQTFENTNDVEKTKELGRDSIVQLALNLLDKSFQIQNYEIKVLANKTSVVVSFFIPIKYVPNKSEYFYDAYVDITESFISYDNYSNPRDYFTDQVSFYKPTQEHQKNIKFVLDAIQKNGGEKGIPAIDLKNISNNLIIREKSSHFDIEFVSETYDLMYKIKKGSGKITGLITGYLEPQPVIEGEEIDEFQEIKE